MDENQINNLLRKKTMTYKIAIIGSGPSAFYAAQALFKSDLDIKVDMFEKLATPYGLLRGGVAPDHQINENN